MKGRPIMKMSVAIAFIALSLSCFLGCAESQTIGNGGKTNWLRTCRTDIECGKEACVRGACSIACTSDDNCSNLRLDAACGQEIVPTSESSNSCDIPPKSFCLPSCKNDRDCEQIGDGYQCEDKLCRPTQNCGSSSLECVAMDARSSGDNCVRLEGYAWDGTGCVEVNCGCLGSECEALYETRETCIEHYSAWCCPAIADSCPASCIAIEARPYDSDNRCMNADMSVLGCLPEGSSGTDDIGCARASDGKVFFLSSGTQEAHLLKYGDYEACTQEEYAGAVVSAVCESDPDCAAMDARSSNNNCERLDGFTWDGVDCVDINCGCVGSECDAVFKDRVTCLQKFAACHTSGAFPFCKNDSECAQNESCFSGTCALDCTSSEQCETGSRCVAEEKTGCQLSVVDSSNSELDGGHCLSQCRTDADCEQSGRGLMCWTGSCVRLLPECELRCSKMIEGCPEEGCNAVEGRAYYPDEKCLSAVYSVVDCVPDGRISTTDDDQCVRLSSGDVLHMSGTYAAHYWNPGSGECTEEEIQASTEANAICRPDVRGCVAMDARSSGNKCGGLDGYAWDGTGCVEVICGCLGSECEALYETRETCFEHYSACSCPAIADSCPEGCRAIESPRYYSDQQCAASDKSVLGCLPEGSAGTDDEGCVRTLDGVVFPLSSGTYETHLLTYGDYQACTQEELEAATGVTAVCGNH
jgi:hypothetical protein